MFLISIYVIKREIIVFYGLGHTIDLKLAFVDPYSGVASTDTVNLSALFFFAKYRPLADTYLDLH